ncbi:MAG: BamA/TamA family outer membrane protein [Sulfurovaceae bacterium]|nr:BamA/TamA family outer membrane protein [Sulfurovaceae bacterium]
MRYIFLIGIVLSTTCIAEQKNEMVFKTVEILGNKNIETESVEDALDISRGSMLAFWKDKTPKINSRLIKTLPETLKSFYESEGFYDATFMIGENNSSIRILVDEKEPIKLESVAVTSDFDISDFVYNKENSVFKSKEFIESKKEIVDKLLNNGYCSYDLDAKAYIDLEKHRADLVYNLKKGDICTFGETTIKGAQGINDSVILSRVEALNGQQFNTQRVKDTYQRIEDLDAFDTILVNADRKIYNVVPIDITLKNVENPYYFSGGIGYDSFAGMKLEAQLVKRNFFDNAQKLTLTGKYSMKDKVLSADFFKPALFYYDGYYLDFGLNTGYSDTEFEGFGEEKEYIKGFLVYQFDRLLIKSGIGLENINIYDLGTIEPGVTYGTYVLNYPFLQVVYDARDDRLNPKNGYYFSGYAEYGMPYNTDASDYTKFELEARGIYTHKDITFSAVGKIGAVEEISGHVPESKLFFGGGMFSNRAYGYNQLGVITSPTEFLTSGALSMANLSCEINFPINEEIYGAVFTDNTMLSQNSYDFNGEIISSAGIGVRYITPVGPLKIDIGSNINDVSQFSIQFQLGQSF